MEPIQQKLEIQYHPQIALLQSIIGAITLQNWKWLFDLIRQRKDIQFTQDTEDQTTQFTWIIEGIKITLVRNTVFLSVKQMENWVHIQTLKI